MGELTQGQEGVLRNLGLAPVDRKREALGEVINRLSPLAAEERERVVRAVAEYFGLLR